MKKKATIGKKMSFNKTTIAQLNTAQQTLIAGGMPPLTFQVQCIETREASCNTIPYTQQACVLC
nr:class I lanthipeptide [uncultured Chitinophaga sp.]